MILTIYIILGALVAAAALVVSIAWCIIRHIAKFMIGVISSTIVVAFLLFLLLMIVIL